MTRYYAIGVETAPTGTPDYWDIEGQHRWRLPHRIGCGECGVYGAVGPAYPTVSLTAWHDAASPRLPSSVSWTQFEEIVSSINGYIAPHIVLSPGSELGPFTGTVTGSASDFVLGPLHCLFATPAACDRLEAAGVTLPTRVPANIRGRNRVMVALEELEIACGGVLAQASYKDGHSGSCSTCGRQRQPLEHIVLESRSVPPATTLIRPRNHATVILASQQFVEAYRAAELTGLSFEEVALSA